MPCRVAVGAPLVSARPWVRSWAVTLMKRRYLLGDRPTLWAKRELKVPTLE
ncbi:hypothetical protein [Nonomuraea sp. MG754425]|uniref:hypothetical protein n=1 Tax=Nonomuraea sp. MG754425 TaxID=2570319 RepID=UPI001F3C74E7|nr:hypothetical protein [Nonomuraea sp. MG754425]